MFRKLLGLTVLAGCACLASPVHAAITYQYVTDQTTYTATGAGATVNVQLFLQETLTNGDTSLINPTAGTANSGLFGAGVAVQQTGTVPTNASTISTIATNQTAIGVGGGFGTNSATFDQTNVTPATPPNSGTSAALIESIPVGTAQGPTTDSTGRILLGTLTLTAGAAGTTTTFSITSFTNSANPLAVQFGEGNTVTNGVNGFDLDSTNNAFNGGPPPTYTGANDIINTFTVTVAPEPSSMLLCGLAVGCGGAYGAYRRRKAQGLKAEAA
jgi:hypothetical protein